VSATAWSREPRYHASLDQPLLAEVTEVARTWVCRTVVVVAQITTGDYSKRADGRERSRLRGPQRVLATSIANDLALRSTGKVEVFREDVGRIVSLARLTVALAPSFIVRMTGIRFRFLVRARASTDVRAGIFSPTAAGAQISPLTRAVPLLLSLTTGLARIVVTRVKIQGSALLEIVHAARSV
jgi:hypothetical protein